MVEQIIKPDNPYVGPRAFRPNESLYGREREARELVNLLLAERIVLLLSPSGAGKTSLINAALLPRMQARRFHTLPTVRVNLEPTTDIINTFSNKEGGEQPDKEDTDSVQTGFNRYVFSMLRSLDDALPSEIQMAENELARKTLREYLDTYPRGEGKQADLLIIDQFEEILTIEPADRDGKKEFFRQLGEALDNNQRWALIAMREDYVAALDPYLLPIPTRFSTTFRLDFLTKMPAVQAIREPACQAGVEFREDAAEKLVDDLRKVRSQRPDGTVEEQYGLYVEPMQLQVVCYRLWDSLEDGIREILPEHVEAIGDVDSALASYYALKVANIATEMGVLEKTIREWFEGQLITDQGIRGQVLRGAKESAGLDNGVISTLENSHLIRAEKRRGATWYELAHDRLIKPVRSDNSTWFQANLSLLQRQAALWESQNRAEALLLGDQAMDEALPWVEAHQADMTNTEREFLRASAEARERREQARFTAEQTVKLEAAEKVAEAERLRAEEQTRANQKLRQRAFGLVALLTIAVLLTVWALYSQASASRNAAIAQNQASTATNALGLSYLRGTEAADNAEQAEVARGEAISNLGTAEAAKAQAEANLNAYQAAATEAAFQATQAAQQEQVAQEKSKLALASQLSSLSTSLTDRQLDLALLLSLEANVLTTTTEVRSGLMNALQSNPNLVAYLSGHTAAINALTFDPNENRLASASDDGSVRIWDIHTGKAVGEPLLGHDGTVTSVAFHPNGTRLASGGCAQWERSGLCSQGEIRIWDPETRRSFGLEAHNSIITSLVYDDSGNLFASASSDNSVIIWDTRTNRPITGRMLGHNAEITGMVFTLNSRNLVTAGLDGTILLWNVSKGEIQGSFEDGNVPVTSIDISSDGKTLVSGHTDGRIRIWSIALGREASEPLITGSENVLQVAFQPGANDVFASVTSDGFVRTWNISPVAREEGQEPILISRRGHNDLIQALAFSPKGDLLATGSRDKNIILWHAQPHLGLQMGSFVAPGVVTDIAFEPGVGDTVRVATDGIIYQLDVDNGQNQPGSIQYSKNLENVFLTLAGNPVYLRTSSAGGTQAQGIDVSRFQGEVDWKLVKSSGIDFAFIKATQGDRVDPNFIANWEGAQSAGVVRGAYHVFDPAKDPEKQAELFIKVVNPMITDLPLAVDVENHGGKSNAEIAESLLFFLEATSQYTNQKPIIYTYAQFWNVYLENEKGLPEWAAAYPLGVINFTTEAQPTLPKSWSTWTFWLYDDKGKVSGIEGNVSMFRFNGSLEDLRSITSPAPGASNDAQKGSSSDSLELVNAATGNSLGQPLPIANFPSSTAVNLEETLLLLGNSNGTISLWDLEKGVQIGSPVEVSTKPVTAVAINYTSTYIAAGGQDGILWIWSIHSGQPDNGVSLIGHNDAVQSLAFSPDGSILASGGERGTLILWDMITRQSLGKYLNNSGEQLLSLVFTPDSSRLVSSVGQSRILVWSTSYAAWVDEACAIANRTLTMEERAQYLGGSESQTICP